MDSLREYRKEVVFITSLIVFAIIMIVSKGKIIKGIEGMGPLFVVVIYGLGFVVIIKNVKLVVSHILQDAIKLKHALDNVIIFFLVEIMIYTIKDIEVVRYLFWVAAGLTILRILSSNFSPTTREILKKSKRSGDENDVGRRLRRNYED